MPGEYDILGFMLFIVIEDGFVFVRLGHILWKRNQLLKFKRSLSHFIMVSFEYTTTELSANENTGLKTAVNRLLM